MVAAGLTSKLAFHSKNQCGVLVSGTLNCVHAKSPSASTFHEVQNLRDFELIKSPSKDKRWAIRESSAKVSRFYLLSPVREANDEQWGPEWNEQDLIHYDGTNNVRKTFTLVTTVDTICMPQSPIPIMKASVSGISLGQTRNPNS